MEGARVDSYYRALTMICAALLVSVAIGGEQISIGAASAPTPDLGVGRLDLAGAGPVVTVLPTFTITPSAGPNGSISPSVPVLLAPDQLKMFKAYPDAGFLVDSWSLDGTVVQVGGAAYTLTGDQADHSVHVTFKPVTDTITPSAGAHGSISPSEPVQLPVDGEQTFEAGPDTGYTVDVWSLDSGIVQVGGTTYTVVGDGADHDVSVTFKQVKRTITPSAGPHGSISPSEPILLPFGEMQSFEATAEAGYTVDTWSLDGAAVQVGGGTYTIVGDEADHAVHVTFKQLTYTITPFIGEHGAVSPASSVVVLAGSDLTLTATPDPGYKTDTWLLDGGVAQMGGDTFELVDINADHEVGVTFLPLLTYDLGEIDFNSDEEFTSQIVHNNVEDPNDPQKQRIHVERLEGQTLDPRGVMVLHSLKDRDHESPTFGEPIPARAKAAFPPTTKDEILVRFRYLFTASGPGVEMIVYVSDVPELLDHDDPARAEHYLQIARVPAPPPERPGAAGSGRPGVFEQLAWIGSLDCTQGVWIELELIEPEVSNSVEVDAFGTTIQCYGICLDINWDNFIDVSDFLKVIGECGRPAAGELACVEGVFSRDGVVDSLDTVAWDWALNSDNQLLSLCKIPLTDDAGVAAMSGSPGIALASADHVPLASLPDELDDLLIVGKRGASAPTTKLQDRLYVYATDRSCMGYSTPAPDRGNIRLVQDPAGEIYLINSEHGLLRLDGSGDVVIAPDAVTVPATEEPRYGQAATVYVGLQDTGASIFGRPVLDVAFDESYAYVLPVVVSPDGSEPYLAAARMPLVGGVPSGIDRLYDEPPLPGDNQVRNALRELEIDSAGNVYVLNAHSINESDILWRFRPDRSVERVDLGRPDSADYCRAPTALFMSPTTDMLYLASSQENEADYNTSLIYGYATDGPLTRRRTIAVSDMQNVAGIAEDPATGRLWVVGFSMQFVPMYPNPTVPAFYYPCLASIDPGATSAQAQTFDALEFSDLALPLSLLWTGQ